MANPFELSRSSRCKECDRVLEVGDQMFAHNGSFVCSQCADDGDLICPCGNYKKPEFDRCFDCHDQEEGW